jgi:hypothetical protein
MHDSTIQRFNDLTIPRFNAVKARGAHGALRASTRRSHFLLVNLPGSD